MKETQRQKRETGRHCKTLLCKFKNEDSQPRSPAPRRVRRAPRGKPGLWLGSPALPSRRLCLADELTADESGLLFGCPVFVPFCLRGAAHTPRPQLDPRP